MLVVVVRVVVLAFGIYAAADGVVVVVVVEVEIHHVMTDVDLDSYVVVVANVVKHAFAVEEVAVMMTDEH